MPDVRTAAVQAIGILGDDAQAADLVELLQATQSAKERADIEMALLAISGRTGARAVPALLPLAQNGDSALRIIALHVLASAGGPEALAAVKAAVEDKDETVQDEAVRTLSTWPNNWPEDSGVAEPLLALAKSGSKTSYQVLALRGYLQYVQGDKQLKDDEKVGKVTERAAAHQAAGGEAPRHRRHRRHPDPRRAGAAGDLCRRTRHRRRRLLRDGQAC